MLRNPAALLPEGGLRSFATASAGFQQQQHRQQQQQQQQQQSSASPSSSRPHDLRSSLAQFSLSMFASPSSSGNSSSEGGGNNNTTNNANTTKFSAVEDDDVCFNDDGGPLEQHHQHQQPQRGGGGEEEDDVVLMQSGEMLHEGNDAASPGRAFQIPQLPTGHIVVVRVLSTWGSDRCVGLSGIEFFDENGEPVPVPETNVLEIQQQQQLVSSSSSSDCDSRRRELFPVTNVVKEPFDSTDDCAMWLQVINNINKKTSPSVLASFALVLPSKQQTLSAVRLWNYNGGGRTHLERGARAVEVFLDEQRIFVGELRQASGDHRNNDGVETVLFCDEVPVLTRIAEVAEARWQRWAAAEEEAQKKKRAAAAALAAGEKRPAAVAMSARPQNGAVVDVRRSFVFNSVGTTTSSSSSNNNVISVANSIQLVIGSAWDGESLVGLSALEFLDERGESIAADKISVECSEGVGAVVAAKQQQQQQKSDDEEDGYFVPELVDGDVNTRWLHQVQTQFPVVLTIRFSNNNSGNSQQQKISALRVSNFAGAAVTASSSSSSSLPTTLGVKHLRLLVDGKELLDGQDTEAAYNNSSSSSNASSPDQLQWLIARKAPAGSHRMSQLLFQTWTAATLASSSSLSSSSSAAAAPSASITTAARVAILRANYAGRGKAAWPAWAVCSNGGVDTDVPYLPCAYTFSLSFSTAAANAANTSLTVSNLVLLDEEGAPLSQDFVCWEPEEIAIVATNVSAPVTAAGPFAVIRCDGGSNEENDGDSTCSSSICIAFETMRCVSLLAFDVSLEAEAAAAAAVDSEDDLENNNSNLVELTVSANDVAIYGTAFGRARRQFRHVVPFVPDERILAQFKQDIVAGMQ